MVTISLCMIVKNEEDNIEKCLASAEGVVNEIIIVDTGSTDRTKEIVSAFTDKIFDFQWIDDFSAARNFSFEQATMEFILWLDADDVLLPEDTAKLIELKQCLPGEIDAIMMKYNTGFDQHGNVTFSYFRERLVKRSRGFKWREPVHEYLETGGHVFNSDICVTHMKRHKELSTRNIEIYEKLLDNGETLSIRGMYYYARELKDHGRYREAGLWFNSFLDSGKGWVEDNITACGELARCALAEDKHDEALGAMLRSFTFDVPRAEICCQIGYYFKTKENYRLAAFWFELILSLDKSRNSMGFRQDDCWGYIPCIECAVCYDKLGERKKAALYNDMALEYKPGSAAAQHNKEYFDRVLGRV